MTFSFFHSLLVPVGVAALVCETSMTCEDAPFPPAAYLPILQFVCVKHCVSGSRIGSVAS